MEQEISTELTIKTLIHWADDLKLSPNQMFARLVKYDTPITQEELIETLKKSGRRIVSPRIPVKRQSTTFNQMAIDINKHKLFKNDAINLISDILFKCRIPLDETAIQAIIRTKDTRSTKGCCKPPVLVGLKLLLAEVLYLSGLTTTEAAELLTKAGLKIGGPGLYKSIKGPRIVMRNRGIKHILSPEEEKQVLKLYKMGATPRQLSEIFTEKGKKINENGVYNMLRNKGAEMHPRGKMPTLTKLEIFQWLQEHSIKNQILSGNQIKFYNQAFAEMLAVNREHSIVHKGNGFIPK